jgi:hypothetical protein
MSGKYDDDDYEDGSDEKSSFESKHSETKQSAGLEQLELLNRYTCMLFHSI